MRFLLLVLAASTFFATGCLPGIGGCDVGPNYDSSPVTLTAPKTSAARVSCDAGTAFAGGFKLSIDAVDGSFQVSVDGSAPLEQATPLNVGATGDAAAPQVASSSDKKIGLSYQPGQTPADDSGLASAIVTVVSEPASGSSGTLTLDLNLRFVDGRELSQEFTAPVEKASPCPVE